MKKNVRIKPTHSLEALKARQATINSKGGHRVFYWIWADDNGRHMVLGAFATEDEAFSAGINRLKCPFEVVALGTMEKAKATASLKGRYLLHDDDSDIKSALKRVKHLD